MSNERAVNVAAAVAGVLLLAVAVVYFAEPASSLPGWLPGHEAGSSHHHIKHGITALVVALGAGVLVWFRTGPQARGAAGR
ncbi:MAG: hypothetical protein U0237_17020 [Thermoleophilia bacterium]